jgi:hypothetical protein
MEFKEKVTIGHRSWLVLAIFDDFFLVSADDPPCNLECWWVPILDKPINNVLYHNILFKH